MNVENILQLADHLETLAPSDGRVGYDQTRYVHPCGTPACIAGHACALAFGVGPYDVDGRLIEDVLGTEEESEVAARWLGIDEGTAKRLFAPRPFRIWGCAGEPAKDPEPWQAARVLRTLVRTRDVRWDTVQERR